MVKLSSQLKQAQIVTAIAAPGTERAVGQVDRHLELARQSRDATAVIGVLVGNQNCIQLPGLNMQARQTPDGFTQENPQSIITSVSPALTRVELPLLPDPREANCTSNPAPEDTS